MPLSCIRCIIGALRLYARGGGSATFEIKLCIIPSVKGYLSTEHTDEVHVPRATYRNTTTSRHGRSNDTGEHISFGEKTGIQNAFLAVNRASCCVLVTLPQRQSRSTPFACFVVCALLHNHPLTSKVANLSRRQYAAVGRRENGMTLSVSHVVMYARCDTIHHITSRTERTGGA